MPAKTVVLLTSEGRSGRIAAAYLGSRFPALQAIVETPPARAHLLRRRLKRLGLITVIGQLAFMLFQRAQERAARARIAAIVNAHGLRDRWPDGLVVHRVSSVNAPECADRLAQIAPAVVLVVGTRVIEPALLRRIAVPFINYHAGITPRYRGVHGGYWAMARGDAEHCGVTVHLIDEGIDTGGVLYQRPIAPGGDDNFSTLPYLQLAAALPDLEQAARDALAGRLAVRPGVTPSQLWSHPTLWAYVATGLRRGVW